MNPQLYKPYKSRPCLAVDDHTKQTVVFFVDLSYIALFGHFLLSQFFYLYIIVQFCIFMAFVCVCMCVCCALFFEILLCFLFASLFSKEREKVDVELEEWEVRG